MKLGDVEFKLPIALFHLNTLNLPVVPELILGREDFIENFVVTFYKSDYISMYLNDKHPLYNYRNVK